MRKVTAGQPFHDRQLGGGLRRVLPDAPKVSLRKAKLAAIIAETGSAQTGQTAMGTSRRPRIFRALPLIQPPYGTMTAINMNTGDFRWQIVGMATRRIRDQEQSGAIQGRHHSQDRPDPATSACW
jgi:hypothetical protein